MKNIYKYFLTFLFIFMLIISLTFFNLNKSHTEEITNTILFDSNDTKLSSLTIYGYESSLSFDSDTLDYSIQIFSNTYNLNIDAVPNDSSAKVTITGNEYLINNTGTVTIRVSNGKTSDTVYSIFYEKSLTSQVYSFPARASTKFTTPSNGTYLLEVWGARGGNRTGYGGYTRAYADLYKDQVLYVTVGGQGAYSSDAGGENNWKENAGGYNGGGNSYCGCGCSAGGGASHIASVQGEIQNLKAYRSQFYIVAGGAGGGFYWGRGPGTGYSAGTYQYRGSTSGVFGKGGRGTGNKCGGGGGGGGWYAGAAGGNVGVGSGGSGYFNPALVYGAAMYCVDCGNYNANGHVGYQTSTASGYVTNRISTNGAGGGRITRVLPYSENNYLSNLTSNSGDWNQEFSPSITEYKITVPMYQNSITLEATKSDETAVVTGDGTHSLELGYNEIQIMVVSQSGAARFYMINVLREGSKNTHSSEIATILNVKGAELIQTTAGVYTYDIHISSNNMSAPLEVTTYSNSASYTISGNDFVLAGDIITITVSDTGCADSIYYLTVNYTEEKVASLFSYTGSYQTFVAPTTGKFLFELWGASGGTGNYGTQPIPGRGAYTSGYISLNRGDTFYIYVGGKGENSAYVYSRPKGGWNGGGNGSSDNTGTDSAGAGGGATDVRLISGEWDDSKSLASRIMVAGGGGGGHATNTTNYRDACDAGTTKISGYLSTWAGTATPTVNQTTGNAFGKGANGVDWYCCAMAGGGGGYYGGVGVVDSSSCSGRSSGGSSYISGHTGSVAIKSESDTSPKDNCTTDTTDVTCSYHYSDYIFTDTTMVGGGGTMPTTDGTSTMTGNTGNGYAKISIPSLSENNFLKRIYTDIGDWNIDYNPRIFDYTVTVEPYADSVILSIEKYDDKQTVTGTGLKELEIGNNEFAIEVTSESGDTRVYNINVYRQTIEPSSLLYKMKLGDTIIQCEDGVTDYSITINNNQYSLDVKGFPFDPNAIVTYSGFGYIKTSKTAYIIVNRTGANPEQTIYTINIIKDDISDEVELYYTGAVQTFTAKEAGFYLLETWGAQGGSSGGTGGYGAYSTGLVHLNKNDVLYVYVGGAGGSSSVDASERTFYYSTAGWNGGGTSYCACGCGSGGGATHIALNSNRGVLSKYSNNRDEVLIVAAGGGGAYYWKYGQQSGSSGAGFATISAPGSKITSGTFGLGGNGSGNRCGGGAGGGGWTGGNGGGNTGAGNGGLSYIASTNLTSVGDYTKHMTCYNCSITSTESQLTKSTTKVSSNAVSDYAKSGNGAARITYINFNSNNYLKTLKVSDNTDITNVSTLINEQVTDDAVINENITYNASTDVTSIKIDSKPMESTSTIDGNGTYLVPAGSNKYTVTVTAENLDEREYNVTINRDASTKVNPANIEINGLVQSLCNQDESYCKLHNTVNESNTFSSDIHEYSMTVPSRIKQVKINVIKGHLYQEVKGDGIQDLTVSNTGITDITIEIKSEACVLNESNDPSCFSEYVYHITRDTSSDTDVKNMFVDNTNTTGEFTIDEGDESKVIDFKYENPDVYDYYFSVPYEWTNLKYFYYEKDAEYQTIEVEGNGENAFDVEGKTYLVQVHVTAPNGLDTATYRLHVFRELNGNIYLSSLVVKDDDENTYDLNVDFNKALFDYEVTIPFIVNKVNINYATEAGTTTAIITSSNGTVNNNAISDIPTGKTDLVITTTSQNSLTGVYTIQLTRMYNDDSSLSAIDVSTESTSWGIDSEDFDPKVLDYTVNVDEGVSSVTITPTLSDNITGASTYKLLDNNSVVVGNNLKRILVTAEDGTYTTYTINVVRPASTDATLSSINIIGSDSNDYSVNTEVDTYSYEVNVPNEVNFVNITGIKSSNLASITGNGKYYLQTGVNTIQLLVTAENKDIQNYIITINRAYNSNPRLSNISGSGTISPEFDELDTDNLNYTINVPYTTTKMNLIYTPSAITTNVTAKDLSNNVLNGKRSNNSYTLPMSLSTGDNQVKLITLAEDGTSTLTYNVNVVKAPSDDKSLKTIRVKETKLREEENDTYIGKLPFNVDVAHLIIELNDSHSSYLVTAPSGLTYDFETNSISGLKNETSENKSYDISILVTSEDTTTRLYIITLYVQAEGNASNYLTNLSVDKGILAPSFDKDIMYYDVEVENNVTSITVSGTLEDDEAIVTGLGLYQDLKVGDNDISVVVTATDGYEREYQIIVNRKPSSDATLKQLSINGSSLSPGFISSTFEYTTSVDNTYIDFSKIATTSDAATYEVINNEPGTLVNTGDSALVTIKVTAEDKVHVNEYKITVTKLPSGNNNLASLSVVGYTLTPEFNKNVTSYRVNVEHDVTSVLVEATSEDSGATITGTGAVTLTTGVNNTSVNVTSESGVSKNYLLIITRAYSDNANIEYLSVNNGSINKAFNKNDIDYDVIVDYSTTALDLSIVLEDSKASYVVSGNNITSNTGIVTITVTAEDGTTEKTYTLNVTKDISKNALLKSLTEENYDFKSDFNSYIYNYSMTVNYETTKLTLTAVPMITGANVEILNNDDFIVGENKVIVRVTALDNETKQDYVIKVTRNKEVNNYLDYLFNDYSNGDFNETFNKLKMKYTLTVPSDVSSIVLYGEKQSGDSILSIDYNNRIVDSSLESVSYLGTFALNKGENKIKINVTNQGYTRTYIITVTRLYDSNKELLSLLVRGNNKRLTLTPEFEVGKTNSYSLTVDKDTNTIEVIGTVSPLATLMGDGDIFLEPGLNVISLVVTAEDGTTETTTLNVTKEASEETHLIDLVPSSGSLSPVFAYETITYNLELDSNVTTLFFDATLEDGNATITGLDERVVPDGESVRTIVVTAEDKTHTRTYTINIKKVISNDADLLNLEVKDYNFIDPSDENTKVTFNKDTYEYYVIVNNSKLTLNESDIILTKSYRKASVSYSSEINLSTKEYTEYAIVVTAEDGSTKNTYKIYAKRKLGSDSSILRVNPSIGYLETVFSSNAYSYVWKIPIGRSVTLDELGMTLKDENATYISSVEDKTLTIVVTSEDGSSVSTYIFEGEFDYSNNLLVDTLRVFDSETDYPYEPTLDDTVYEYTAHVYENQEKVNVSITPQAELAKVLYNSNEIETVELDLPNDTNTFTFTVLGEDGVSEQNYTLIIKKDVLIEENASSLEVVDDNEVCTSKTCKINPTFNGNTTVYKTSVPYEYEKLKLSVGLNEQQSVKYFIYENDDFVEIENGNYDLDFGATTVYIFVYDMLGKQTKTYRLSVTRNKSTNTKLNSLTVTKDETTFDLLDINDNPISFSNDNNEYYIVVPYSVEDVKVNYTKNDDEQKVALNGYNYFTAGETNDISVKVTAPDKKTIRTIIIHAYREAEYEVFLENITVSSGIIWNLAPAFDKRKTSYVVNVSNGTEDVKVEGFADTTTQVSEPESRLIETGVNDFYIVASKTIDGEVYTKTYKVTVIRPIASEVYLSSLVTSSTIDGEYTTYKNELGYDITFDRGTTDYYLEVSPGVKNLNINATPGRDEWNVNIYGNNFATGRNIVSIIVYNEEYTTSRTYQIVVTVKPSEDSSLTGIKVYSISDENEEIVYGISNEDFIASVDNSYSVRVPYNIEKVNIKGTASVDKAVVIGEGEYYLDYGNNELTIYVEAEDGIHTTTYTVNVYREYDLFLSDIKVDDTSIDEFDKNNDTYELTVTNDVKKITFEGIPEENDATVSYSIDSGSSELATITEDGILYTGVGLNKVVITVTAPDNTFKNYYVNIMREQSDNNYLEYLEFDEGIFREPFEKTKQEYSMYILDTYTSLDLSKSQIIPEDSTATYTVSGYAGLSKTSSNIVTVAVTCESGKVRNYTIEVILKPEAFFMHYLKSLKLSYKVQNGETQETVESTLSPIFAQNIRNYTVTVPYSVSSITANAIPLNDDDDAILSASTESGESLGDATYPLNFGRNVISIRVTSSLANSDGSFGMYKVIVYRSMNATATLQSLAVENHPLSPSFNTNRTSYTIDIDSSEEKLNITAIPTDPGATVEIIGNGNFKEGANTITIKVTAADNVTTKNYYIIANCTLSDNNYLSKLEIKDYLIDPVFNKTNTGVYTTNVDEDVTSVYLTALPEDSSAKMSIMTASSTYDKNNISLKLNPGNNYVYISVTSAAGNTRTYTLNIFRSYSKDNKLKELIVSDGVLVPDFESEGLVYNVTLDGDLALLNTVTVIGIKNHPKATVIGNGDYTLNETGTTTVKIKVKAQSGDEREYTVNFIKKEAPSSKLKLLEVHEGELNPEFSNDGYKYYLTVPYEVTSLDLTLGVNVIPEDSDATVTITGNEDFKVGINIVTIKVTATNGDTKTYLIYVTRSILASNYLSDLYVEDYQIEPEFNADTLYYTLTVGSNVESVHVYAEKEEPQSTLEINGSVNNDKVINLDYGENKVYFTVTSENGASRTYTLVVTRSDSDEYYLLTLSTNLGTWNKEFNKDTNDYVIDVSAKTNMIVFSGTSSVGSTVEGLDSVQIKNSENNHKIVVTSPSGLKNTYNFTINRPSSNNANATITSDQGELTLDVDTYKRSVDDSVSQIKFIVTPEDSDAKVVMDEIYHLNYGKNEITIKVIAEDGVTEKTYAIEIYRYKDIESINYTEDEIILNTGASNTPEYTINPSDTDYKEVTFRSDDETIATVDANGEITGVGNGVTYVYVVSSHNSKIYDWIKVNVASTKISSSVYKVWHLGESENELASVDFSYTIGVNDKTSVEEYVKNFDNNPEHLYVFSGSEMVTNANTFVGTGMKLKLIINDHIYDEVVIVVRGDNGTVEKPGNGIITSTDYATLSSILAGLTLKTPMTSLLYDLNKNKILTVTDLSPLSLYIAGKATFTNLNGL